MIKMDIHQFVSNAMLVPQQLLWHMLLQAGRDSIHTTQKIFNSCIGRNAINANRIYVGYTDVAVIGGKLHVNAHSWSAQT